MNSNIVTHEALEAFGVVMHNYSENKYLTSAIVDGKADKSEIKLELDEEGDLMPIA